MMACCNAAWEHQIDTKRAAGKESCILRDVCVSSRFLFLVAPDGILCISM